MPLNSERGGALKRDRKIVLMTLIWPMFRSCRLSDGGHEIERVDGERSTVSRQIDRRFGLALVRAIATTLTLGSLVARDGQAREDGRQSGPTIGGLLIANRSAGERLIGGGPRPKALGPLPVDKEGFEGTLLGPQEIARRRRPSLW